MFGPPLLLQSPAPTRLLKSFPVLFPRPIIWASGLSILANSGEVSKSALLALLNEAPEHVQLAAAIGHWHVIKEQGLDESLGDAWRDAIIRSAEASERIDDIASFWIGEILKKDNALATAWMTRLVQDQGNRHGYSLEEMIKEVVTTLEQKQLRAIVNAISPHRKQWEIREIVAALVGNSVELYWELLKMEKLKPLHLVPLAGKPDDAWVPKAVLALDHGYTMQEVGAATQDMVQTWTGPESDVWAEWRQYFDGLQAYPDLRISGIGEQGSEIMRKREEDAKARERQEEIYGV